MFSLERIERIIIAILVVTLIAGLGYAVYRRSIPVGIQLKTFDPKDYKSVSPKVLSPARININTASAGDIASLKGIGDALAGRIVAYRTENGYFISTADIKKVRGIGDALFEKIKDSITTE